MYNKKGREPHISGLVFLIAVLIILYTLVLPPCDKCKLLGGDCTQECKGQIEDQIILSVSPGSIGDLNDNEIIHDLGSTDLFIKSAPETKTLVTSLQVKNGLFGASDQDIEFKLDDLENLKELTLSFSVMDSRGDLIITVNGVQIYNEQVNSPKIIDVTIPIDFLEETNKLELKVSPPGLTFWLSNFYSLKDINLKQEFEAVHSSEKVTFSLSASEIDSITDSDLDFFVYCKGEPGQSNILRVYLNNRLISSELLGCFSGDYTFDIDEDDFEPGLNELEFSVTGGEYLISDVELRNEIDGEVFPSYVFFLRKETYDNAERFYLNLDMENDNKNARILVNDDTLTLDTDKSFIEYDITSMVKRGNNFIEIRPIGDSDFRIHELRIGYE